MKKPLIWKRYCALTIALLSINAANSVAVANDYLVEVIVFNKQDASAISQNNIEKQFSKLKLKKYREQFKQLAEKKTDAIYIDEVTPTETPSATIETQDIDAEQINTENTLDQNIIKLKHVNRLAEAQSRLIDSGYNILIEGKWIQPARVFHKATLVSLGSLNEQLEQAYIKVYKTSLIYANIDIEYIVPKERSKFGFLPDRQIPPLRFFISEKRRLKFNEIHYFDHPQFGVILSVSAAKKTA